MTATSRRTAVRPHPQPRVLQVVLSLNPGGTERLVLDLVGQLREACAMAVCCIDQPGAWADRLQQAGVDVTALNRKPGFRPSVGAQIAAAVRRHRATVIHAHHYSPFIYSTLARPLAGGVPVIYTEHGRVSDTPPSRKRYVANRVFFARSAYRVFAVSEELGRHLVAEGFNAAQVGVIPNGITLPASPAAGVRRTLREELGAPEGALVVGTIARLDPVKDLGTLLGAAAACRHDLPVIVAVVGDGAERAALTHLATQLGIQNAVRFLGHRDDARDWLNAFDVFVNCSLSEGVSLTILEAMAAGLPVVATNVGGTPEVVTAESGLLVPPRDSDAIARALKRLARDPATRERMGAAGRARVEGRFTSARMIDAYRQVYEAVS